MLTKKELLLAMCAAQSLMEKKGVTVIRQRPAKNVHIRILADLGNPFEKGDSSGK